MDVKPIVSAVVCVFALSACQSMLDSAREQKADALAYSEAGHAEYLALAEEEAGRGDAHDRVHFAQHAVVAATGDTWGPDTIGSRDIPPDSVKSLRTALAQLLRAFDRGARTINPEASARAQARFDCWMERVEDGDTDERIRACRRDFYSALGAAREGLQSQEEQTQAKPERSPTVSPPTDVPADRTLVYFGFDSATLVPDEASKLDQPTRRLTEDNDGRAFLTGHADRAGAQAYNRKLSLARAEAVKQYMIERRARADRISVAGRGEAEPKVPTPDGVRERQNRRVEVIVE